MLFFSFIYCSKLCFTKIGKVSCLCCLTALPPARALADAHDVELGDGEGRGLVDDVDDEGALAVVGVERGLGDAGGVVGLDGAQLRERDEQRRGEGEAEAVAPVAPGERRGGEVGVGHGLRGDEEHVLDDDLVLRQAVGEHVVRHGRARAPRQRRVHSGAEAHAERRVI